MCYRELPADYILHETVDLQKNKKQFWIVNGLSFAIALIFVIIGEFIQPIFDYDCQPWEHLLFAALLLIGMALYMVLHELTHGIFLYSFTKVRPKFGFVGWAAYCGNTAYCDKRHYIVVALAPVLVWGIVFGALNVVFRSGIWFWLVWLLQMANVGGASGDLYVAWKVARSLKEILVGDTGLAMKLYRPMTEEELRQKCDETEKDITMSETNG